MNQLWSKYIVSICNVTTFDELLLVSEASQTFCQDILKHLRASPMTCKCNCKVFIGSFISIFKNIELFQNLKAFINIVSQPVVGTMKSIALRIVGTMRSDSVRGLITHTSILRAFSHSKKKKKLHVIFLKSLLVYYY